jgi:hypothetical protein
LGHFRSFHDMRLFKFRKAGAVLLCLIFVLQPPAFGATDAILKHIVVTNTRDDLLLYLSTDGAFREKMKTAILSGVPATFSFFITLNLVRNFWPDKTIADIKVTHTIKYDSLKKEFKVNRSWENGDTQVTTSFDEAQRWMTEIASLKITPLSALEKGRQYQISAKAKLSKLTLPFYLHYVLFFVALWDFETDWYTVDFTY